LGWGYLPIFRKVSEEVPKIIMDGSGTTVLELKVCALCINRKFVTLFIYLKRNKNKMEVGTSGEAIIEL
jgi:hypothetical protein